MWNVHRAASVLDDVVGHEVRGLRGGRRALGSRQGALLIDVLPDEAPYGQIVHHELVPVVVPDRALEFLDVVRVQRRDAHRLLRLILPEPELHVAIDELVTLQDLPEAAPLVLRPFAVDALHLAERQLVIIVRLLRVVEGADLVDPERDSVADQVLMIVLIGAGRTDERRDAERNQNPPHCVCSCEGS